MDWSVAGYSALGGPVGWAVGLTYGVADYFVQDINYTVQYGSEAGNNVTGWTSLLHIRGDQGQKIMELSPRLYNEMYYRPKY